LHKKLFEKVQAALTLSSSSFHKIEVTRRKIATRMGIATLTRRKPECFFG